MKEYKFYNCIDIKEDNSNLFVKLNQEEGDIIYFGIHDLYKIYRDRGCLPILSLQEIDDKKGEIVSVNIVDQIVRASIKKSPFNYGYRKLSVVKNKMRRYMRADGNMEVKIPASDLQDISHLIKDAQGAKIWLAIDTNTKYQKNLIRDIRKREMKNSSPTEDDKSKDCVQVDSFDPRITSKTYGWKMFNETKVYEYYKK